MALSNPVFDLARTAIVVCSALSTLLLVSCGGASTSATSADATLAKTAGATQTNPNTSDGAAGGVYSPTIAMPISTLPTAPGDPSSLPSELPVAKPPVAYDLNGFVRCGGEGETINLPVRTHMAYGIKEGNRLVYLFNQIGKVSITTETFGGDAAGAVYKTGYCKKAVDGVDAPVFATGLAAIKAHLDGSVPLTGGQINTQIDLLAQTMYAMVDNKENLVAALAIVDLYEAKQGGAVFINARTKNGKLPKGSTAIDGFEADRAVLAIQQGIHDLGFTPTNFAKYHDVLVGKKFNSSDWFPGKVKVAADPTKTYTAKIKASMPKDQGMRTAYSQYFARRPTGYYLAAGDVATVTVPKALVNTGFIIRVGANVHAKAFKNPIERPFGVVNKFPIVSETTEIANPYGGGIYIDAPYLSDAGVVDVKIKNVVPAPFFSATAHNKTTLIEWQTIQRNNGAPWADFESDKYMMQVPTSWIYKYEDPVTLMNDWDKRMDAVSELLGHPLVRNNYVMYSIVDLSIANDAFGIGYPTGNNSYNPSYATDGNNKSWFLVPGKDFWNTEFHELGHAQLFSSFPGEGESSVNLLAAAVASKVYAVDIDLAFAKSFGGNDRLTREQSAMNWMVTPNFRAGKAMDISNTEKDEVRYQHRGHAKYVEVAALFGWTALENFYKEENRVADLATKPASDGLNDVDSRIFRMSKAAGADLTPLIHFWGVQPVDGVKLAKAVAGAGLKASPEIYDRLVKYQSIIPMTNAAFKLHASVFFNKPADKISNGPSPDYGEGWYYVWLNKYGPSEGEAAQIAMTNIVKKYFPNGRPQ